MGIIYVPYGAVRVSRPWRTVLRAADRAKVGFHVTSGHRTMSEQAGLVREKGLFDPVRNPHGAAAPSPFAPHVRIGRANHAIDVDSLDGGETRLERWVDSQGATWMNTVVTESWHGELSGRDLARLARKIKRELRRERRAKARQARRERLGKVPSSGRLSPRGVDFLVGEEGLVPHAYNDPAGNATFGVGHLLHLGPVNDDDVRRWGSKDAPKPHARATALRILSEDVALFERAVKATGAPLLQCETDALVSFAFNIGVGAFAASTVAKRLKAGDHRGAADAILLFDRPAILKPRRKRERRLFLTGKV
jgi:lysozyme